MTIDNEALPSPLTTQQIPSLVSHAHTPRYRHVAENVTRRAVYVVLTAALVVPVWLATRDHFSAPRGPAVAPLDVQATFGAAGSDAAEPVVASIAPISAATPAVRPGLVLEFTDESWLQLFDAQGRELEGAMVDAGQRRDLAALGAARVVIGNVAAVRATDAGEAIDLKPFAPANVARFALSSGGSLAPLDRR